MSRKKLFRVLGVIMILSLLISSVSIPALAQEPTIDSGTAVASSEALAEAPVQEVAVTYETLPELTEQQLAQLKWAEDNTHLAPPIDKSVAASVAGPVSGTETVATEQRVRSGEPLAPGDAVIYRNNEFGAVIPGGYKSNVMESSVGSRAKQFFYSGNWFAAWSKTKGSSWNYLSSFTGFPDFCCDQVVLHDDARDIYLWLRMGVPDAAGQNVFKLSVDYADPFTGAYWTYTTAPTNVNAAWVNEWWDYPHLQMGADYLYLAWNMFNAAGSWTRTLVLRWPLDALAAGAGFGYSYYSQSEYFTFVPVSGASHTMYFASNWAAPPYDHLRIWRWNEDSGSLTFWTKTIAAWTGTGRGDMHCGTPNWLARGDQRLLTGALYEVNNDGIAEPRQLGREVVGWWWNVAEGGGFTLPYIEGAAFYEETMGQLPGFLGRPYVYGSWCFAYPSMAPNGRGDLGAIFNYSDPAVGLHKPQVAISLADDLFHAPPGWLVVNARISGAGPSDVKWGDYNTTRNFQMGTTFYGGAHFIPGAVNCSNCSVPVLLVFGRERDQRNFWNSQ